MTVKNRSAQQFEPTMAHPTASSGGQEGDQVYDGKVGGNPDTTVLPGKTINCDVASGCWPAGR